MLLQLSSGQGPMECELAVGKLAEALQREFPGVMVASSHQSRYAEKGCYDSVLLAFGGSQDVQGKRFYSCG